MHLLEFRVKNFRSIIDSGWNNLSSDNITALIGQNESGKTSVLEALFCFYDGNISEDVLRSDLSIPEVSCAFTIGIDELPGFTDPDRFPPEVISAISEGSKVVLTRKWSADLTSQIFLSGQSVSPIFDDIETGEQLLMSKGINTVLELIQNYNQYRKEITEHEGNIVVLKSEIEKITKDQNELSRLLRRTSDPSKLETLKKNAESAGKIYDEMAEKLAVEQTTLKEKLLILSEKEVLREYAEKSLEILEEMEQAKILMENAWKEIIAVERNIMLVNGEKERKSGEMKLFEAKENYIRATSNFDALSEDNGISIRIINTLIKGGDRGEAEQAARKEYQAYKKLYTREEAGEFFFQLVPSFEFFEDFSSLLPNRIDLEDIFEDNKKIEGFKAVRNFLIIAGLDPEFFRQTNNRILKQKIENLNNEVTIDFQEYWRQNVGKTNKIKIHFELEHYDISHPEKKGKPYLEFWIKDDFERLYPKQRSRGVRWFLSFYLELKAFARENENKPRVLLIDEPGLSLHACAQEDVLKVFEDIRGKIQIIYSTHSPHLIDHTKLYRLLAVQRANENSEQSETIIYDSNNLHSATSDTLSPVSSIIGASLSRQQLLIRNNNNIIVEDISCFYYLSALYKILKKPEELSFLPANGPAGVTTLVSLLVGWGMDFSVLLFGNETNRNLVSDLTLHLQDFDAGNPFSRLQFHENIAGPEDLFSTLDFKKHIIRQRIGISEGNSEYIKRNDISRPLLASGFAQSASSGQVSADDLDEETKNNLNELFDSLLCRIRISDETL